MKGSERETVAPTLLLLHIHYWLNLPKALIVFFYITKLRYIFYAYHHIKWYFTGEKICSISDYSFFILKVHYILSSPRFSLLFFVSLQLSLLAFTLFSQKRKSSLFSPVLYVYFASQPTKLTQHSFPLSFLSILSTSLLFSSRQPVAGNLQVSCMYSWVSPIHSHTHITFLSIFFSTKQL